MESREITVVSTKTQSKTVLMSEAETLGELKQDLDHAGVDYTGLTFYEGISKIELKTDESLLPHDLMYKGTPTNKLVFMLTQPDKKIASGLDRNDLYKIIKTMGYQNEIKEVFNKNYTQVKNEELYKFIVRKEDNKSADNSSKDKTCDIEPDLLKAFKLLIHVLRCKYYLSKEEYIELDKLSGQTDDSENGSENTSENKSSFSDDELDELFGFVK